MSDFYELFATDPDNPISEVYDVLLRNTKGAIPIFLHMDGERIALDLRRVVSLLLYGDNAMPCLRKMAESLTASGASIRMVETGKDVDAIYIDMMDCYRRKTRLPVPQIIMAEDIGTLYESSGKTKMNLIEVLVKGHGAGFHFLCCSPSHSLPIDLSVNFGVKIEMFDSPDEDGHDAIFFNVCRNRKVRFDREDFS